MPTSRIALYAVSLASAILAARSALGKPLSLTSALALGGVYLTMLALGALSPRLGLFADVMTKVAPSEFALVVRCDTSDVDAWRRALEQHHIVATFSLPFGFEEASLRSAGFGTVSMVDESSMARFLAELPNDPQKVNIVDVIVKWHAPWLARALRKKSVLWLVPREEVESTSLRIFAAPGRIVAVRGKPDAQAVALWSAEISEARVTLVALGY